MIEAAFGARWPCRRKALVRFKRMIGLRGNSTMTPKQIWDFAKNIPKLEKYLCRSWTRTQREAAEARADARDVRMADKICAANRHLFEIGSNQVRRKQHRSARQSSRKRCYRLASPLQFHHSRNQAKGCPSTSIRLLASPRGSHPSSRYLFRATLGVNARARQRPSRSTPCSAAQMPYTCSISLRQPYRTRRFVARSGLKMSLARRRRNSSKRGWVITSCNSGRPEKRPRKT